MTVDRLLIQVNRPVAAFTLTETPFGTTAFVETEPAGTSLQTEGIRIFLPGATGLDRADFEIVVNPAA